MKLSLAMKKRLFSLLLILGLTAVISSAYAQESEEPKVLKGMFIERSDDTFLHVEMVGVRMKFNVLDETYNPLEEPVFTRGVMRVEVKGRDSERVAIAKASDGKSLQGVKTIRKPHILEARGRLFKGEGDTTGEPFFVRYNQHRLEEKEVVPIPEK